MQPRVTLLFIPRITSTTKQTILAFISLSHLANNFLPTKMEGIVKSLYLTKIPRSQTCSASLLNSPLLLHSNATSVTFNSATNQLHKCFLFQQSGGVIHPKAQEKGKRGAIHASEASATPTTNATQKWILEPIG